jgi:hypothetical protein
MKVPDGNALIRAALPPIECPMRASHFSGTETAGSSKPAIAFTVAGMSNFSPACERPSESNAIDLVFVA